MDEFQKGQKMNLLYTNPSLRPYLQDVMEFDSKFQLEETWAANIANLAATTNALAGEVGEVSNVVKKIWRDGENQKLLKELHEETVDVMIYLVKLIIVMDIEFDRAWKEKHEELYERWENAEPGEFTTGYEWDADRELATAILDDVPTKEYKPQAKQNTTQAKEDINNVETLADVHKKWRQAVILASYSDNKNDATVEVVQDILDDIQRVMKEEQNESEDS